MKFVTHWKPTEIVGGEFGGVFQRRHGGETASGRLEESFLYNFSSRVSTFGGC